ncbi:MAG: VacJ family lipoprotein [Deltaproteobacteria bacterium]|nr:MAG: VacJ family lipoprotein [Deltaproteobacteria bacterium]
MTRSSLLIFISLVSLLSLAGCASSPERADTSAPPEYRSTTSVDSAGEALPEKGSDDFEDPIEDPFSDPFADDESGQTDELASISDPLEPINRVFFYVNDKAYFYFFKPIARGWRAVAPEPVRVGIGNVFSNLMGPLRILNSILQLDLEGAAGEFARFALNTTIGLLGWFDLASERGYPNDKEDFGQTLGYWGVGTGPYLVLPFFGPSTLRDGVGLVGDLYLDPVNYTDDELNWHESAIKAGVEAVNTLSLDKDTYEGVIKESVDPYLFMRNAYLQRRKAQVKK